MTKICVSIKGKSPTELKRKALEAIRLGADLIEFRLDYLEEPFDERVHDLIRKFHNQTLVTLRERDEGGRYSGSIEDKIQFMKKIAALKPMYIDLELRKLDEDLVKRLKDTKLIISWHSFEKTPSLEILENIVERALKLGDLAKIVTRAEKLSDQLRILRLYNRFDSRRLIAFTVGSSGILSRLISAKLGSPITYVSLPDEPLAEGQPNILEFMELMNLCR